MTLSTMKHVLSLPLWLALMIAASAAGCAGSAQYLTRGEVAYAGGDFATARSDLQKADEDKYQYSGQQLARLALYRGLTAAALGMKADTGKYLAEAKIREEKDPGSLTPGEKNKMNLALDELAKSSPR